jgi:hypothetical protein
MRDGLRAAARIAPAMDHPPERRDEAGVFARAFATVAQKAGSSIWTGSRRLARMRRL